jgi:transposase
MTQEKTWIGIDVSQDQLDVSVLPQGINLQQPNTAEGVQALIQQLKPFSVTLVAVESTGGLERLVVAQLQAVDIPVAIANPRQVKGFAVALGKAKTDKLDAEVIARFAQTVQPRPQKAIAATAQQLTDLNRRRQQLTKMQVAEKNRLTRASEVVKADIKAHIKHLQQQIDTLTEQIQSLTKQQPDWYHKNALLQSVKGIGKVTAALFLAELPDSSSELKILCSFARRTFSANT